MIIFENNDKKIVKSENYNYQFDKKTGYFARWGKTKDDNPEYAPAPEILDLEITDICEGINGKVCPFCFPEGTMIKISTGEKDIKDIVKGDKVYSYNIETYKKCYNTVEEIYKRKYEGLLINIELEDNTIISCTPEHPIYVKNLGWILAKELTEDMEVIKY